MKTIDTLADDIKGMLGKGTTTLSEDALAQFGSKVALHINDTLASSARTRKPKTLFMSEIGKPCLRQLWYQVNMPHFAEPMQQHTLFKFFYGDLVEEATLALAEAAGHKVELRQHRVTLTYGDWVVNGRVDAAIDDVLVDVKSCSPFGYKKFVEGLNDSNDSFGYRAQLSGYNMGLSVGLSGIYKRQGFLAVDKQNGHIGFFESPKIDVNSHIKKVVDAMDQGEPDRHFALEPMGTSGNMKLCMECSYCPFKAACWRDANHGEGLKGYFYSNGPVFLGTVVRPPAVAEMVMPNTERVETELRAWHAIKLMKSTSKIVSRSGPIVVSSDPLA